MGTGSAETAAFGETLMTAVGKTGKRSTGTEALASTDCGEFRVSTTAGVLTSVSAPTSRDVINGERETAIGGFNESGDDANDREGNRSEFET